MYAELKRHRIAYTILLLGVALIGTLIFAAWPNREVQRYLIAVIVLFYFIWGVLTHVHSETITRRVILEYGGVALLAGSLLALMTF